MVLASELHQCEVFWSYAREVEVSGGDQSVVRTYAQRYVPRSGPHGDQDVIAALLRVASEYVQESGSGRSLRALVDLAGPVAYFADDPLEAGRLSGLPEPSDPRRTGTSGRAASLAHLAILERGAEVVRKRGASRCLAAGCEADVALRSTTVSAGTRRDTERVSFCQRHRPNISEARLTKLQRTEEGRKEIDRLKQYPLREALDSARAVLIPAAYAWRARPESYLPARVEWSSAQPRIAEISFQAA